MVGLVIDGGLLMANFRHTHNAADAAALAAAMDLLRGQPNAVAIATGTTFVTDSARNNLPDAVVTIHIPPSQGPYAGSPRYVEAIVENPANTIFIQVLPGLSDRKVGARAVAGYEFVAAGEGVITLNPQAWPGLKVTGNAQLRVRGDILVNSEGGGVDENGDPVETGNQRTAISVANNASVVAENVNVVGGVNDPNNFENVDPSGSNPLHANSTPTFDPLLYLDTPSITNGVVNARRGAPQASDGSLALNNESDGSGAPNYIEIDPLTGESAMVLRPGIYDSIKITGGRVRFEPGIYVLSPTANTPLTLDITGGDVTADGIMFYNTGSDYDPVFGTPDNTDLDSVPNPPSDVEFGGVLINAGMEFSPIDTDTYAYDTPVSEDFNGMLFYQRRWNTSDIQIEGNSADGNLSGTLYAKWADVKIAGQGTYDAQFVVGSMDITGQGDITIDFDGDDVGRAPRIFLVE
jgi:hypothetical protein